MIHRLSLPDIIRQILMYKLNGFINIINLILPKNRTIPIEMDSLIFNIENMRTNCFLMKKLLL